MDMDEFIKLLDKNLEYISHRITGDTVYITVESVKKRSTMPVLWTYVISNP